MSQPAVSMARLTSAAGPDQLGGVSSASLSQTINQSSEPLSLVFVDTDVSYSRDSLVTGSFRPYYYNPATLLTGGRTFLIQPSDNASLCLTFANVTAGMQSDAILNLAGLPLQFTNCVYKASGKPAQSSQVGFLFFALSVIVPPPLAQLFKVLKRCDSLVTSSSPSGNSSQTPFVLQMWSMYNENGTNKNKNTVPVSF